MLRKVRVRLRQLWQQCDLFDSVGTIAQVAPPRPLPPTRKRPTRKAPRPRVPKTNPKDEPFVHWLTTAYEQYNATLFGGKLSPVPIRISRRMKNRLGHYMAATPSGLPAEIAISWRHIRRDSWDEVLHTLVHEMVHQWQDQNGLPIDHGRHFRAKAKEIGISGRATRRVA